MRRSLWNGAPTLGTLRGSSAVPLTSCVIRENANRGPRSPALILTVRLEVAVMSEQLEDEADAEEREGDAC